MHLQLLDKDKRKVSSLALIETCKQLEALLERCRQHLEQYAAKSFIWRILEVGNDMEAFMELRHELRDSYVMLTAGLQLASTESDAEYDDAEKDLDDIEQRKNEFVQQLVESAAEAPTANPDSDAAAAGGVDVDVKQLEERLKTQIVRSRTKLLKTKELLHDWSIPLSRIEWDPEEKPVGEGTLAKIYLGKCEGKPVAIKVLRFNHYKPSVLAKTHNEIKTLVELNHDNIVQFYGICAEPNHYAIVMDYCENGSLADYLHQEGRNLTLSWDRRYTMMEDLAQAIEYLHARKFVHRNLRSSKVLLKSDLTICITGFGDAILRDEEYTRTLQRSQTHPPTNYIPPDFYSAPEILTPTPRFSSKSDVFAYAVLCWEIATCRRPWEGRSLSEVYRLVTQMDERLVVEKNSTPEGFEKLLEQMWTGDSERRPEFRFINQRLKRWKLSWQGFVPS
ncbi:hypothetical protein HK102_013201 [Quaeritorhiza haematococci]|nr:hypothetical protein HK102_013201 [Quaeritorhiza haematococci]